MLNFASQFLPEAIRCQQQRMQQRFTPFKDFLDAFFDVKVQKLTVNAGMTCPNRDGRVGRGGCTYCNNRSFNPAYCADGRSVALQLEEGKEFFARKYPQMKYLAYFQSFTNTYGDRERLMALYEEALGVPDVVGLVLGTRPDCVENALLDDLADLHRRCGFVMLEYGVESCSDAVLRRINRGHDFACAADAIRRTAERGLPVGAHLILGLPGEEENSHIEAARKMSELPLNVLKLHQLQLVRGTKMAEEYAAHPGDFRLYEPEEYAALVVDFLEYLRPGIAVERFTSQSPADLLIAPDWGLKNYEFVELVKRELTRRDTYQCRLCAG